MMGLAHEKRTQWMAGPEIPGRAERVQEPLSDDLAEINVSILPRSRLLELLASGGSSELASAAALGLADMHLGRSREPGAD
jgi:hypothetical protein